MNPKCKSCQKELAVLETKVVGRTLRLADATEGYCEKCWPAVLKERAEIEEERSKVALENEKARRRGETERALIEMLGGPLPYKKYRLENFKATWNPKALAAITAFDHTKNVYVHGACGSGKTHLAVGRMIQLAEGGRSVYFFRTPTLMRRVRKQESSVEEDVINELASYDVLVWDDAGVGRGTEFMIQIIYEIIERRWANERNGLIVTSNLFLDKLAEQIGDDRLTSRLVGLCEVVNCGGVDRRR